MFVVTAFVCFYCGYISLVKRSVIFTYDTQENTRSHSTYETHTPTQASNKFMVNDVFFCEKNGAAMLLCSVAACGSWLAWICSMDTCEAPPNPHPHPHGCRSTNERTNEPAHKPTIYHKTKRTHMKHTYECTYTHRNPLTKHAQTD